MITQYGACALHGRLEQIHAHAHSHAPGNPRARVLTRREIYNTYCFSTNTMVSHTHIACLVYYYTQPALHHNVLPFFYCRKLLKGWRLQGSYVWKHTPTKLKICETWLLFIKRKLDMKGLKLNQNLDLSHHINPCLSASHKVVHRITKQKGSNMTRHPQQRHVSYKRSNLFVVWNRG
jgi:hypothetical protein